MKKKLFTLIIGGCLGLTLTTFAQDFKFTTENPLMEETSGTTNADPEDENGHETFYTNIENLTENPLTVKWTFLSTDTTQNPEGWIAYSLCDNSLCRYRDFNGSDWYTGESYETNPILPTESSVFELTFYIPRSGADGTGIYKFELESDNQKDTFIYQITKQPTSISVIPVEDKRVNIYPNPAREEVIIYTDKNLNAQNLSIYNIVGRKIMNENVTHETSILNINNLAAGVYILNVSDKSGNMVATRKFIKQ